MKTYEEMANSALEKINAVKEEQIKRRKTITRIGTAVIGFCFVAVISVGIISGNIFKNNNDIVTPISEQKENSELQNNEGQKENSEIQNNEGQKENSEIQNNEGQKENSEDQNNEGSKEISTGKTEEGICIPLEFKDTIDVEDAAFEVKYGKHMTYELSKILENGEDGIIPIILKATTDRNYVYKGKTVEEYYNLRKNAEYEIEKLESLLKDDGERLKYGEKLYLGGAPEKWAKSLYDQKVAFYGDLIDKYIQNGVFLKDELEKELEAKIRYLETEYSGAAEREASEASVLDAIAKMKKIINVEEGVKTQWNCIIAEFSKDEFKEFTCDGIENWFFDIAIVTDGAENTNVTIESVIA